jgi:hypothetical protein
MDLDAPENPTSEEWATYLRYKQWQDKMSLDTRPRLSLRTFQNYIVRPLTILCLGCIWWGVRTARTDLLLLGCAVGLLPLVARKVLRIRS